MIQIMIFYDNFSLVLMECDPGQVFLSPLQSHRVPTCNMRKWGCRICKILSFTYYIWFSLPTKLMKEELILNSDMNSDIVPLLPKCMNMNMITFSNFFMCDK